MSLASRGSSYSMNPKPFINLISVMFPLPPSLEKWFWMSSLVTAARNWKSAISPCVYPQQRWKSRESAMIHKASARVPNPVIVSNGMVITQAAAIA